MEGFPDLRPDGDPWGKPHKFFFCLGVDAVDNCAEVEKMERETGFEPATLSLEG